MFANLHLQKYVTGVFKLRNQVIQLISNDFLYDNEVMWSFFYRASLVSESNKVQLRTSFTQIFIILTPKITKLLSKMF